MEYYSLNVELANIECEKALLVCEAQEELSSIDGMFYEEKNHDSIIKKAMNALKELVDKIKDWFKKHFTKSKKMYLPEKEAKEYTKLQKATRKLKNAVSSPYAWYALGTIVGAYFGTKARKSTKNTMKSFANGDVKGTVGNLGKARNNAIANGVVGTAASVGTIGAMVSRGFRNTGSSQNPAPVVGKLKALGIDNIEDDYIDIANKLETDFKKGKINSTEYTKRMVMLRHALNMCYRYATHAKTEDEARSIRLKINSDSGNPIAIREK